MKYRKFAVLLCLGVFAWVWTGSAGAQAPAASRSVRIAVVDLKKAIDNYKKSKDLDKRMGELKAMLRQKIGDKERELAKKDQARKFLKNPSPEYASLSMDIERQKAELAAMRQSGEVQVRELFRSYVITVFEDVERAISATSQRYSLDLVFKKEETGLSGRDERELSLKLNMKSVLYASSRLDITDRVIRTLNTEYARTKRGAGDTTPKKKSPEK